MTTYAGYYYLVQADKEARRAESRSNSAVSTESSVADSQPRRNSASLLKKFLDQLRPIDETITPSGIYSPIIKKGPLFQELRPADEAQEPTPIYAAYTNRTRPLFGLSSKKRESTS